MAASPQPESAPAPAQDKYNVPEEKARDVSMAPPGDEPANGGHPPDDRAPAQGADSADYRPSAPPADGAEATSRNQTPSDNRGEKQIKPNKVYIGGLPEHTRKEDLESCFGKIGNIVNIELKLGYGFVEFDNREAAEESVAKYHEGYFMGNKIRVELSRGGGRTAKYSNDPGACFKCGQLGHWARECPNVPIPGRRPLDPPLIDRIQPPRDYLPPPRDYPPYRDDYRYPARDPRIGYEYPPPPVPGRDYRRPPSPPRDVRDYPPPSVRSSRDYDDYRLRGPPPPLPPPRYDSRAGYYPPESDVPPGYPPRGYPPPPPRDYYDRYDRRAAPPPADRYAYASGPPPAARPRTPPGVPPRVRDEYDRPPREYSAPAPESRARPVTPPPPSRYSDYPSRGASPPRYSRRSRSPPPRSTSGAYESASYRGSASAAYNGSSSAAYGGNGFANGSASRSSDRDYSRGSRDEAYRRP
ncbi:hypothetical protein DAEQUDRAFT_731244 [Daedalea quercina L-15889]|uniref:RNA-binding domain-containing protein n=1 Tax=Daedalea quercina L-15889 TaxID=1314783 RepID=A0A165MDX9_9APHY|nr:hypothetical protein DAEQUDRAFT_731244 [Daedalea quercina L-15889]